MKNQENKTKPTIFSGVQPSGVLHLGNYLGAITQWLELQDEYNCIFCVVDYHAITIKQEPKKLRQNILDLVKTYLASGINPEKSIIFQQSDISAHTELAWILNCLARVADLNKMTQFKEKAGKDKKTISVGLYDYPILMAADILLYDTDAVPVGEDQVQHVELTRTLAQRFNREFGQVFKIPEVIIKKQGARIMGLDDPSKKMSKSATSPSNYLALTDAPELASKKIMRAVTDSGSEIKYQPTKKPAIANLLVIYSLLTGQTIKELESRYHGQCYAKFKTDLAQVASQFLSQLQKKYQVFGDEDVKEILRKGASQVRPVAEEKLRLVKTKLGIN